MRLIIPDQPRALESTERFLTSFNYSMLETATGRLKEQLSKPLISRDEPVTLFILIFGIVLLCICSPVFYWLFKTASVRSFAMVKFLFRASGVDKFGDFDVIFTVHEVDISDSRGRLKCFIRISCGKTVAQSSGWSSDVFEETLAVPVEQGSDEIRLEAIDEQKRRVAELRMTPQEIIEKKSVSGEFFRWEPLLKGVPSANVKMSYKMRYLGGEGESVEETSLPQKCSSSETPGRTAADIVREEFQKVGYKEGSCPPGDLQGLVLTCRGFVERYGLLGDRHVELLALRGPLEGQRYMLGLYADDDSFDNNEPPLVEVDASRLISVKPDPSRPEVFFVFFFDSKNARRHYTLRCTDRGREVWIALFSRLIVEMEALVRGKQSLDVGPGQSYVAP